MTVQRHRVTATIACITAMAALLASILIFPLTRVLPEDLDLPFFFRLGSTTVLGSVIAILMGMAGLSGPHHHLHTFAIRCGSPALVLLLVLYLVFTTLF